MPPKTKSRINIRDPFDINSFEKLSFVADGEDPKLPETEFQKWRRLKHNLKRILVVARVGMTPIAVYKAIGKTPQEPHSIITCELNDLMPLFSTVELNDFPSPTRKGENMKLSEAIRYHPVFQALLVQGIMFYTQEPEWYSVFAGYSIEPSETLDKAVIQPILDHWLTIMCCGNVEKYEWWLNWCAFIIQNPAGVSGRVPILLGLQGCGKTVFVTDILARLIGTEYSVPNCTDSNNIFGKYNSLIEFKKLVVLNEARDTESTRGSVDYDRFKSVVMDSTIDINPKNEKQHISQNVCNVIICSNNAKPITVDQNDRRVEVFNFDNRYANDLNDTPEDADLKMQYFDKLGDAVENPSFYPNLMKFFMDRDIKQFKPSRSIRSKDTLQFVAASKTPIDILVEDYVLQFVKGWNIKDMFEQYLKLCKEGGYIHPKARGNLVNELSAPNNRFDLERKQRGSIDPITKTREYYLILSADGVKKRWKQIGSKLIDESLPHLYEDDDENSILETFKTTASEYKLEPDEEALTEMLREFKLLKPASARL